MTNFMVLFLIVQVVAAEVLKTGHLKRDSYLKVPVRFKDLFCSLLSKHRIFLTSVTEF